MSIASAVRLGLIGAGRWGRNYISTISRLEDVELGCVASRSDAARPLVLPSCPVTSDWRELARRADLDGVIVATPPRLHAPMAEVCLRAGKPVLVEKPLTLSSAEAKALQETAASTGCWAMVEHTHLFHPAYRRLKRLLPELGPIERIRACAGNRGPFRRDAPVLWDWGAHDVAMCLDLLDRLPDRVQARRIETSATADGLGETVELTLGFGAVEASITVGNLFDTKRRRLDVVTSGGTLTYDDLAASPLVVAHAGGEPEAVEVDASLPLTRAVIEFADAIRAGGNDGRSLALGVDVVTVLERADRTLG